MKTFIFKFDLDTARIISEWTIEKEAGYYCDDCRAHIPATFEAELIDYKISPIAEDDDYYKNEVKNLDIEQFIENNNLWERFWKEYKEQDADDFINSRL